ncbi:hypothetical protein HYH03_000769 [Edaphochlamys debaryana]|uniref:FAS1 domain-containing protein n=1 Tax=Edaphochlamys debaryana TaxID=47281 RepID=A0A835YLX6_9CHLO|nr:hypothetical protein HYH03_000769 [Edaphochlamys debaryana]|eukprot:KAG2500945.1 hypothetical protein HYH03_000769 [Edaphochlamys debaryana]
MGYDTVLDLLASRPDLSLAYMSIKNNPMLAAAASDPNAVATFFCPTNAKLAQVFMYHTIPGEAVYSYNLLGGTFETATALPGYNFTITSDDLGVRLKAIFTAATVTEPDLMGGRTVVHVIDYPLIPFPFGNMTAPMPTTPPSPELSPSPEPSPEEFPSPSPEPSPPAGYATVLDLLAARPDLSIAYSLIASIPELAGAASDPTRVATFFAPNNAGVAKFLTDKNTTLEQLQEDLSLLVLTQLFMYHTIPLESIKSYDLPNGLIEKATALPDYNLTISTDALGVMIWAIKSKAAVVEPDLTGGRTTVHIIDYILLPYAITPDPAPPPAGPDFFASPPISGDQPPNDHPLAPTVKDLLQDDVNTAAIASLIGMAGPLGREASDKDAVFTFFAPDSVAYASAYVEWEVGMRTGMYSMAMMDLWHQGRAIMADDLKNGDTISVGMNPSLPGSTLTVTILEGDVFINGLLTAATVSLLPGPGAGLARAWHGPDITEVNLMGGKAVVHILDKWPLTERTTRVFGLQGATPLADADRSVMEALVVDADVVVTTYYLFLSSFFAAVTDPAWKGTIFVPNQLAWQRLANAAPDLNLNMSDPKAGNVTKFIDEILEQHVLMGSAVPSSAITSGMSAGLGLDGSYSHTFSVMNGKVYLSSAQGTQAEVVKADMMAGAAMIHVVDRIVITDAFATKYMLNMTVPEAPPASMPSPSPPPPPMETSMPSPMQSPSAPTSNATYDSLDAALSANPDLTTSRDLERLLMKNVQTSTMLQGYLDMGYSFFAPTDSAWISYWDAQEFTLSDLEAKLTDEFDTAPILSVAYPLFVLMGAKDITKISQVTTGDIALASTLLAVGKTDGMYSLTTDKGLVIDVLSSAVIKSPGGNNYFYVVDRVIECDDCTVLSPFR